MTAPVDTPESVAREPAPLYTKADETRPEVLRLYEAAQRFIRHFFRNDHERPRIGIPARPDYDDDLVLLAGIRQLANERDEARAALLRAPSGEVDRAEAAVLDAARRRAAARAAFLAAQDEGEAQDAAFDAYAAATDDLIAAANDLPAPPEAA